MTITFDQPQPAIGRHDALRVKTPENASLVLVWYAPDPLLRHWLGRLERRDDFTGCFGWSHITSISSTASR
jgi:hypothetical protein